MGCSQSSGGVPVGSMGCPDSPKRPEVRLRALSEPFLATNKGCVAETFTSFFIKNPQRNASVDVIDAHHTQLAFVINPGSDVYGRWTLQRPDGTGRLEVKDGSVYDGDPFFDKPGFRIEHRLQAYPHAVACASFVDVISGESCRVSVEGDFYDRVVVFYLERGADANEQPVKARTPRPRNRLDIGRIHQPRTALGEVAEYYVDAAPGVDLTLLLLLWLTRFHIDQAQQRDD